MASGTVLTTIIALKPGRWRTYHRIL